MMYCLVLLGVAFGMLEGKLKIISRDGRYGLHDGGKWGYSMTSDPKRQDLLVAKKVGWGKRTLKAPCGNYLVRSGSSLAERGSDPVGWDLVKMRRDGRDVYRLEYKNYCMFQRGDSITMRRCKYNEEEEFGLKWEEQRGGRVHISTSDRYSEEDRDNLHINIHIPTAEHVLPIKPGNPDTVRSTVTVTRGPFSSGHDNPNSFSPRRIKKYIAKQVKRLKRKDDSYDSSDPESLSDASESSSEDSEYDSDDGRKTRRSSKRPKKRGLMNWLKRWKFPWSKRKRYGERDEDSDYEGRRRRRGRDGDDGYRRRKRRRDGRVESMSEETEPESDEKPRKKKLDAAQMKPGKPQGLQGAKANPSAPKRPEDPVQKAQSLLGGAGQGPLEDVLMGVLGMTKPGYDWTRKNPGPDMYRGMCPPGYTSVPMGNQALNAYGARPPAPGWNLFPGSGCM